MADPWSSDLAALGEHTRSGLRSLDATRAALTAPQETKNMKMRFFKAHPALAALVAIAVIALAAPIAYAVAREVWVSIDPDKPASEIQQDLNSQLQAAGVTATATADKTDDGKLRVRIKQTSHDPNSEEPSVRVQVGGKPAESLEGAFRLEVHCELSPQQEQSLEDTTSSTEMIEALSHDYPSDADRAAAIKAVFEAHGFHGIDIQVSGGSVSATVTSAPTS